MSRIADYTIQGFLYQFDKTLLEILAADSSSEITIEGPIEDIDIRSPSGDIQAIQCKYHEAAAFTPSILYKPLLQMMRHHASIGERVRYTLFLHVHNEPAGKRLVELSELESALNSSDSSLAELIGEVTGRVDLDHFRQICTLEFGKSRSDLYTEITSAFVANELPPDSIETLFYPNAINEIANQSTLHEASERTITKKQFLNELISIRKTAISKWTLALKTREKILQTRRKQLKANLSRNSRDRCFIISQDMVEEFAIGIVVFVQDYLAKYHFKTNHDRPPTFYLDCDEQTFSDICLRIWQKGITLTDGIVAGTGFFDAARFFRTPLRQLRRGSDFVDEFQIRVACQQAQKDALGDHSYDDVFVTCRNSKKYTYREQDVEIEHLQVSTFQELRYVLGLAEVFE